jgi:hypothetical protein
LRHIGGKSALDGLLNTSAFHGFHEMTADVGDSLGGFGLAVPLANGLMEDSAVHESGENLSNVGGIRDGIIVSDSELVASAGFGYYFEKGLPAPLS